MRPGWADETLPVCQAIYMASSASAGRAAQSGTPLNQGRAGGPADSRSFGDEEQQATSRSAASGHVRPIEWATAFLIVLLPFTLPFLFTLDPDTQTTDDSFVFYPLDLGLAIVAVLGSPLVFRHVLARRVPGPGLLLLALAAVTLLATAVNLGPSSAQFGLRMLGVVVLVVVLVDLGPRLLQGPVFFAVVAVGLEQSLLATGQAATGRPLGLSVLGLGELSSISLPLSGGETSARGTMFYPYMLAGLAVLLCTLALTRTLLLRRGQRFFWMATALISVPIGLTYSRMSVLTILALICVVVVSGRQRRSLICFSAVLLGVLLPALATAGGWIARGQQTVDAPDAEGVTSGRLILMRQAWQLIESAPLLGVGPGNYVNEVSKFNPTVDFVLPVHNVPLLVAAEGGVVAGLLCVALIFSLGVTAVRSGVAAMALFAALLPFLMLDVIPYRTPQGIVMFGLWIGAILGIGQSATDCEERVADRDKRSEQQCHTRAGSA